MKRQYFIFLVFAMIYLGSYGQYQAGFKGAYIYYEIMDRTDQSPHYIPSYTYKRNSSLIAVYIKCPPVKPIRLSFELNYLIHYFEVNTSWGALGAGTVVDYHYKIGYLNFKILPEIMLGPKKHFYIKPGIYLSRLLHSDIHGIRKNWSFPTSYDTLSGNANDHFTHYLMGVSCGFGREIPLKNNLTLIFENNYSMNLGSLSYEWGASRVSIIDISFEIGISYMFNNLPFFSKNKR